MAKPKYRIWVVILRTIILSIPVILLLICDFISDKSESLLIWLARKLPQAERK